MGIGCQVWPLPSAAMKYCHHRQKQLWDNVSPGPLVPDPIVKILISHPLSPVNTSILRARPLQETYNRNSVLTMTQEHSWIRVPGHSLGKFRVPIIRFWGFQTVQKSYRLTSSYDNVVKNSLSPLNCFWWATQIPDLCLFFRKLYCQFFGRKLMSILHFVKTGKRTEEVSNDVLYNIFSQLTTERTRTSRIKSLGRFMTCFCHFFSRAIIQFTPTIKWTNKWMFQSSFVT